MNNFKTLGGASILALCALSSSAFASSCLEVTLTGTQGGPPVFQGQAGAGTLVTYGSVENGCRDVMLQFDTGRGTTQRLSEVGVPVARLHAIFLTHIHSDHSEGLPDMMQLRWHFASAGPRVDLVCSADTVSPLGHVMSCANLGAAVGNALIESGEMAQRLAENPNRLPGGPADLVNMMTFDPAPEPVEVWRMGDVVVTAVNTRHVPGHASYRVDTPAGAVVIGGDAGNDAAMPPREFSTSTQVEMLAEGADMVVHSVIHPIMGPDGDTGFPPPIFFRQSTATDLGAMAERAGVENLMLTHLIPPMGAPRQGNFQISDTGLTEEDYILAVEAGGFNGNVVVGQDLTSLRLVAED